MRRTTLSVLALLLSCRSYVYERIYPQEPYLPNVEAPEGLGVLDAKTCGACHQEIYQEWSGSLHKIAWTDPLFQADFVDLGEPYMCAYCHAPLGQQRPTTVTGLASIRPLRPKEKKNPTFDASLRAEGVTCVVCHLRDGALIGPHLLSPSDAPHAIRYEKTLGQSETCKPCHFLRESFGTDLKRPIIDTFREWEQYISLGGSESCADCHMPKIARATYEGGPLREGRRHVFLGHNDLAFVSGALALSDVKRDASGVSFTIENLTGHRFPTGEPGRYVLVFAESYDASGALLSRSEVTRIQRVVNEHGFLEGADNTLAPKERRSLRAVMKGGASLRVVVEYLLWDPASAVGRASGLGVEGLRRQILSHEIAR